MIHIPTSYFESTLQVLRYEQGQLYDAHRDYWDPREFPDPDRFLHHQASTWMMRHATVLWFLQPPEEGGDTWFPRAHGGPIPVGEWTACDERGVKLGHNGTIAILFYSLHSNGDIDEFSWHCGCPVQKGLKWAANSWLWNQPQRAGAPVRHPGRRKVSVAAGRRDKSAGIDEPPKIQILFQNLQGSELKVFWVDMPRGAEVHVLTLGPESTQSLDSYAEHIFRIRAGDAVVREYIVQQKPKKQILKLGANEL